MQKLRTEKGLEHGLLETLKNSVDDHGYKSLKDSDRKEVLGRKEKDIKIVKTRYYNLKNQETGKWEGWYYGYAGEPMKCFRFLHNHVYDVPVGLMKKINDMGSPKRSGLIDVGGTPLDMDGAMDRTHQLVPEYEY